jgi:hypothetical protein
MSRAVGPSSGAGSVGFGDSTDTDLLPPPSDSFANDSKECDFFIPFEEDSDVTEGGVRFIWFEFVVE